MQVRSPVTGMGTEMILGGKGDPRPGMGFQGRYVDQVIGILHFGIQGVFDSFWHYAALV